MSMAHYSSPADLRGVACEAMLERGLLPEFSREVLAEVERIRAAATAADPAVRDLRHLLWGSIDNDDSLDLDQLTFAEPLPDGAVRIYVAVADVDALVRKDGAIDAHAWTNTTSVYTPAGTFWMIPEKLSADLTSLCEGKERLAVVVEAVAAANGVVEKPQIYRAVVLNHAKLAYDSTAAWLAGTASPPAPVAAVPGLDSQIRLQDQTAQALKRTRHARGALHLEVAEARPLFRDGTLVDLVPEQRNRARELIEDFMVAANGVTADYFTRNGRSSLRRVLPVPKRWDRIVALAAQWGGRLPVAPDARALDAFLTERSFVDPTGFPEVSLSVVKLLGRGAYAVDIPGEASAGHFALAVKDYSHSTAPNRRYPDLVTQRLLKAALAGRPPPYSTEQLAILARHCTEQEDNAIKVERRIAKSAAALLLQSRIGERFDAIVTGAADKGTWVRISRPTTEGRVVRGFEGLDVGDHVRVALVRTDVARGFIDFAVVKARS